MKKIYSLILLLLLAANVSAQFDVNWNGSSNNGNWWNGTSGDALHWIQSCTNNPWVERPDYGCGNTNSQSNFVHFGNNNNTSMNINGDVWYKFLTLTFEAGASSSRSLNQNGNNGLSFTGSSSAITNNSNALHYFNVRIGVDGTQLLVNAANNSMDFNNSIFLNSNNIVFDGGYYNNISGVIEGSGKVIKNGSGKLVLKAANIYSGNTEVNNGELWLQVSDAISPSSTVYLGNGGQLWNVSKIFLSNNAGGNSSSKNIIINNGNQNTRFIGGLNTTGTHTFSGTITNNTYLNIEEVSAGGTVLFSGVINGSGSIDKIGLGKAQLSAANTYTGETKITQGILELGANQTITNSSNVNLAGGTLSSGASAGFSNNLGTLNLSENSIISLGTGDHSLHFAASNGVNWNNTKTLTIKNWQGSAVSSGTEGKIFVGGDANGLTDAQLLKINFEGYSNGAVLLPTGELVPCGLFPVTLTSQPSTTPQDLCLNSSPAPLSVSSNLTGLTYQWYQNTTNSTTNATLITGATQNTYYPSTGAVGTLYYYCKVTARCGNTVNSNFSGAVTVKPNISVSRTSGIATLDQTVLNATAIEPITFSTQSVSSVLVTGTLPPGVDHVFVPATGAFTISGTPTQSGTYNYSMKFIAACGTDIEILGKIKVNSNVVEYANIQMPKVNNIILSSKNFNIYAQVKLLGVTDQPATTQNGINVWIGYSMVNANTVADFATSNWTWIPAVINPGYTNALPWYNNDIDEYMVNDLLGKATAAGNPFLEGTEYFVVSRAQKQGSPDFAYGGIDGTTGNTSGGLWNGSQYYSLKLKTKDEIIWDGSQWKYWDNYQNKWVLNVSDYPVVPVSPDQYLKTEIQGDYPASAPGFETAKLAVDLGKTITVGSGKTLKVVNGILNGNTGNGNIIVENDANLIQVNETDSNSGGGATVYRNSAVPNDQYSFWSSPVANQNLYSLYDGNTVPLNRVMTYNTWNDYYSIVYSGNFVKGTGYSVKGPASGVSNAKFTGTLHNGSFDYPLAMTGQKYNLVGNPYASNLDLDLLYQQNSSAIDPTVYLWDFHNNKVLQQQGGTYMSNYPNHNFAIYNAASHTPNKAPNGTLKPTGKVSVGQGFIVKALQNSLTFKNGQRSGSSAVFFGRNANESFNRYWLKITTPANLYTTLAIVYLDEAANGFDVYDSKIVEETADNLYTFAGTEKVAINGRGTFNNLDRIKVGSSHFVNGNYKISIDSKEGVFNNGQNIYLKDNVTGIVTNLSEGDYTYAALAGTFDDRFEILYQPETTVLSTGSTQPEKVVVYKDRGDVVVYTPDKNIAAVEVYDSAGRMIFKTVSNTKEIRFNSATFIQGMYLMKVKLQDGEEVVRKFRN